MNRWLLLGALSAGFAVAAGSFAAHGLERYFSEKYGNQKVHAENRDMLRAERSLHVFKTGAEYQMTHSLALIGLGLLEERRRTVLTGISGWAFVCGIVLFSGSLYVLTITGDNTWGMVAPVGGVAYLVGWAMFALAVMTTRPANLTAGA